MDDMDAVAIAAPAGTGMGCDEGAAEKRLDAIIVEVDAFRRRRTFSSTTLPDQLRRRAVEDTLDQEAACPGDRHDDLGEVGFAGGEPLVRRCAAAAEASNASVLPERQQPAACCATPQACRWHDATSVPLARRNQRAAGTTQPACRWHDATSVSMKRR